MKRIIIAVLCALGLVSALDAQEKKGVMTLSSKEFKTKVYDISAKNPEYLGSKPAIVDFYASWCGPCKMLSPVVDEVAEENDDVIVCKVNVDDENELAAKFQVASIPTLIVVKDKKIVNSSVGVIPKEQILALL